MNKMERYTFRLDEETVADLRYIAEKIDCVWMRGNMSSAIRHAVRKCAKEMRDAETYFIGQ